MKAAGYVDIGIGHQFLFRADRREGGPQKERIGEA